MGRPRKTEEQNEFNAALGMRIQKLRKERKMKCSELARSLGILRQQLYNYEAGVSTVPPHLLVLIAHSLGVGVAAVMPLSHLDMHSENKCA